MACLLVPQLDRLIGRASRDNLTIGTVGDVVDTASVALHRMRHLALLVVPDLDRTVLTRARYIRVNRVHSYLRNSGLMPAKYELFGFPRQTITYVAWA